MLPDAIEHCIVFMNYWDVSGVLWSFSKCNIKIPHLPADPSIRYSYCNSGFCILGFWTPKAQNHSALRESRDPTTRRDCRRPWY